MNKTVTFIYIATNRYINYFLNQYQTLLNFCPNLNKNIIVLTDNIEKILEIKDKYEDKKCLIKYIKYINHLPWPLITLLKMHYIYDVYDLCDDYIVFANTNLIFDKNYIDNNYIYNDKISLSFMGTTKHEYFNLWNKINPYDENLHYVIGTFFAGPKDKMKEFLIQSIKYINNKLINNIIENKHDESIINYLYSQNPKSFNLIDLSTFADIDTNLYGCGGSIDYKKDLQLL